MLGTVVSSGGTLELLRHGSAVGYQIESGGTLDVGRDASLSGATVSGGATLIVSGGEVTSTTVLSGGMVELLHHGRQTDTTFDSGATLELGDKHERLSGFTAGDGVTLKVLSGGTLIDDTISSGGSLFIDGRVEVRGTLTDSGTTSIGEGAVLQTREHATVILGGSIVNSGTLFARTHRSEIDIVSGATVSGAGTAEIGDGIVNIQAAGDNQDVVFRKDGHGGLELADTAANPTAFGGTVSGFGTGHKQFIELTRVTSNSSVSLDYASNGSSSGVLTVSSGGSVVASINMSGSFTTSSFHLGSGSGGTVEIFSRPNHDDPDSDKDDSDVGKTAVSNHKQLSDRAASFAGTVAGTAHDVSHDQTTTDTNGTDLGSTARLANYMASTFPDQGDGNSNQAIADPGQSTTQQSFLTNPH